MADDKQQQRSKTISTPNPTKRDAFSELMAPKAQQSKSDSNSKSTNKRPYAVNPQDPRSGLHAYISNPETFSSSRVISYNESFVLIQDLYPKATIHLLLLPRDPSKTALDPRIALSADPIFLASVRQAASTAVTLAAKELARQFDQYSSLSLTRLAALESEDLPAQLPAGRDWTRCIRVGVHAHPSMSHLHIHIISEDMHSPAMKHRKHYNSFNTDFFIPLHAFPLSEDDEMWSTRYQNENLKRDFKCWRCKRMFGNRFTELKKHLDGEFEAWRSE